MKILILGGTLFVGRHLVESALARGWDVTIFHRGVTGATLFAAGDAIERIIGDRDGGLAALEGRHFDAVFDTCGYLPRVVGQSARLLADKVGHYSFVSSISVYAEFPSGYDESTSVHEPPAAGVEDLQKYYGPLKVGCEREVQQLFGDRALCARAGLVLGPYDRMNRFPYWLHRLGKRGRCLGPGDPRRAMQWIDARDLAAWLLDAASAQLQGVYNLTGPSCATTVGEMLSRVSAELGAQAELVWPGDEFLTRNGVQSMDGLPYWVPEASQGFVEANIERALAAGLKLRPIEVSARDTWATMQREGFTTAGKIGVQVESGMDDATERALVQQLGSAV